MTPNLPTKARFAVALYMLIYCDYMGEQNWPGLQVGFFHQLEDAGRLPRHKLYGFLKLCGWQWQKTRWYKIAPGDIRAAFDVLYGKSKTNDPIYWD